MQFEQAAELMNACPSEVQISTEERLLLYAYFKQSTLGDNVGTRPSFYQVVERAKHDAYYELKGTDIDESKSRYVKLARTILERVKHEYPLIAQQLSVLSQETEIENNHESSENQRNLSLQLVNQNKSLTIQLKWLKRLSIVLFLIIVFQLKVPFRKILQVYFNKK
eukprot:NODE_45_length_27728_cov_0.328387.p17 type:complete len:166 gc:universal NODE_45_length_27728_cov_0.328387:25940-26437(+)